MEYCAIPSCESWACCIIHNGRGKEAAHCPIHGYIAVTQGLFIGEILNQEAFDKMVKALGTDGYVLTKANFG